MTISLNVGLQGLSRNPLCGNPSKAGFGAILKPDACKTYDRGHADRSLRWRFADAAVGRRSVADRLGHA